MKYQYIIKYVLAKLAHMFANSKADQLRAIGSGTTDIPTNL